MFLMLENATTEQANIVRAQSIVHAEPWDDGVKIVVEGVGEIRTRTFDIAGLALWLDIDAALLESVDEAA